MPRHRTIVYPRKWIEATEDVEGYWQEEVVERIDFTPEEEIIWDAQEAKHIAKMEARREREDRLTELHAKLADGTLSIPDEMMEMLRLERGI